VFELATNTEADAAPAFVKRASQLSVFFDAGKAIATGSLRCPVLLSPKA